MELSIASLEHKPILHQIHWGPPMSGARGPVRRPPGAPGFQEAFVRPKIPKSEEGGCPPVPTACRDRDCRHASHAVESGRARSPPALKFCHRRYGTEDLESYQENQRIARVQ